MTTHFARPLSCLALLLASLIASPAIAQSTDAVVVNEYDVFVDPPTAFAFIKLPTGWKFIGKLDAEQMRRLPEGTLTSLLPAEEDAARVAAVSKPRVAKKKS
jgi:hypothetical protein